MITIHPMTKDDILFVSEIEKECFSLPWSKKAIEEELHNETANFFILEKDGVKTGYLGMHIVLDECYIANIAVKKEERKKGYGSLLLKKGEETAKEKGCSFISLEVRISNENAVSLYKNNGYEILGERKNFYDNPTENAYIMTKYFNKE